MQKRFTRGFSLIELLITIAIMGLLAVFVYPSYQKHILKSRRSEAKSGLLELAQKQEDYRADQNKYAVDFAELKWDKKAGTTDDPYPNYDFTLVSTGKGFSITATAAEGKPQAGDLECYVFTINNLGIRTATNKDNKDSPDCWK